MQTLQVLLLRRLHTFMIDIDEVAAIAVVVTVMKRPVSSAAVAATAKCNFWHYSNQISSTGITATDTTLSLDSSVVAAAVATVCICISDAIAAGAVSDDLILVLAAGTPASCCGCCSC